MLRRSCRASRYLLRFAYLFLCGSAGTMIFSRNDRFLIFRVREAWTRTLTDWHNGDAGFDKIYYDSAGLFFSWYRPCLVQAFVRWILYFNFLALWLGSVILKVRLSAGGSADAAPGKRLNKLLIYNHIRNSEHAMILLSYGKIWCGHYRSGLGGLLCGNILSREGFNVCVLERTINWADHCNLRQKRMYFQYRMNYTEAWMTVRY